MNFTFSKFKNIVLLIYIFIFWNSYSQAHLKGTFSTKEDAAKKSLELGCLGFHKNKGKWLPCKDEKELHKYLNKWKNWKKTKEKFIEK